jgi:hypothetical protein
MIANVVQEVEFFGDERGYPRAVALFTIHRWHRASRSVFTPDAEIVPAVKRDA